MLKLDVHPTQQQIMQAASQLFIEQGFSATSISQIAKLAGINQSLIYHHFANKADLWKAVKSYLLKQVVDWQETELKSQDLRSFLSYIITRRFKLYKNHPELLRLIHWQRLEVDGAQLQGGNMASPEHWDGLWQQWQEQGVIKRSIQPRMISLLIASAVTGALTDQPGLFEQPKQAEMYINFLVDGVYTALTQAG